ncbi:MAG: pectate lyase family protein [Phycisphaerae bacterium]
MMKSIFVACIALCGTAAFAAPMKVRVMAKGGRAAFEMPHWENWQWSDNNASQKFGDITVALSANDAKLADVSRKALLEQGMHLGVEGLAAPAGGEIILTISGLSPGKHTLATYHNEVRDDVSTSYEVSIDGRVVNPRFSPTHNRESDYDIASTYFTVDATAGKPVEVTFKPTAPGGSCIINGFELDLADPRLRAAKPVPGDYDEHVDAKSPLRWTAPASAHGHLLYFGTDPAAVASADQHSPEFKGELHDTRFPLPALDHMKTYYWRVDEIDSKNSAPVKGDVWRFRPRFLAFPTAEGYGRFAIGGRGGRVIEVTNLEDSDEGQPPIPGSYRAAIEATGPRTVVFRVSGVIFLKRPCPIFHPYITVAGQTAPGDGICIANYSAGLATHDAIVRFIRVRVGDKSHKAMDGLGLGYSDDSIIDHCSISWAMDEGTSSRGGHNITFQWNVISEMLQHAYHYNAHDRAKFETHAFAGSISGDIGSFHHNLLAHCTDRNWSLAGGLDQAGHYAGRLDIRDNVVYNWTARTTDGGVKDLDYVDNYYKPYPQQTKCVDWLLRLDPINDAWGKERIYMAGNVMEGFNYDNDNWVAFDQNKKEKRSRDQIIQMVRVNKPLYPSYITEESARSAYPRVLANAGATLPKRDVIDERIVREVRTGTVDYEGAKGKTWNPPSPNFPGIIDSQTDVHDADNSPVAPWPEYKTYNVLKDSDRDGMPDDWEVAHGLNPKDASDENGDYNGDGYTNLEKYLNSLTGEYKAEKKQ